MAEWGQKRAFLFSHPRTASNLLTRILSDQPDWQVADYLFFDAFQYTRDAFSGRRLEDVPRVSREEHAELISNAQEQLKAALQVANEQVSTRNSPDGVRENDAIECRQDIIQHKHILLKDHAHLITSVDILYGDGKPSRHDSPFTDSDDDDRSSRSPFPENPTVLSNEQMLSWQPIILIRNPILVFESWLRAEGAPYPDLESRYAEIYTTMRFQRYILDWYESQAAGCILKPVVLDADDIIERTDALEKLCELLGMDPARLMFEWKPTPTPKKFAGNERFKRFLRTIQESVGIDRARTSAGVTLESRQVQWRDAFGSERAEVLASRVREAWPDYEYLRAVRTR
jgi:hypothetical protein